MIYLQWKSLFSTYNIESKSQCGFDKENSIAL